MQEASPDRVALRLTGNGGQRSPGALGGGRGHQELPGGVGQRTGGTGQGGRRRGLEAPGGFLGVAPFLIHFN